MNEDTRYFVKTWNDKKKELFLFNMLLTKTNYEKQVNFSKELLRKPMAHD
jgi:hypothetical protein